MSEVSVFSGIINIIKTDDEQYKLIVDEDNIYNSLFIDSFKSLYRDINSDDIIDCKSIVLFRNYLLLKLNRINYTECCDLLKNISKQIYYIESQGYSIVDIDIDDIFVVENDDGINFYIGNTQYINELNIEDLSISINTLIEKRMFSSPEILNLEEIPLSINHNSWIYSLGLLCIFSLNNRVIGDRDGDGENLLEDIKLSIDNIEDTKLYYCLLRMLKIKSEDRVILFV